ncbi:MAG: GNAT family N-acetyltransferase [Leptolyngbya sp. RL_3_1]|nr:GNAT family N-acetyltransferase [Leptolyngbya sp. RL_3_1]
MAIDIQRITVNDLDKPLILQILKLQNSVWPADKNIDHQYETYIHINTARPDLNALTAHEGTTLVGYAEAFSRVISYGEEQHQIGCLADVCVLPQRQGQGIGKAIVNAAFNLIETGEFQVFLFQTGVPEFYLKLGAVLIDHQFINTKAAQPEKNPWWDQHVMIYPASFNWFDGVVDLNGEAF